MDKIFNHGQLSNPQAWGPKVLSLNQLFSLAVVFIMIVLASITLYFMIRKTKENEVPSKIVVVVESYIYFIEDLTDNMTDSKLNKFSPYFFGLFIFLALGNLVGVAGLAPVGTSLTFVLAITSVTWIMTFVIGISCQKIRYFKDWLNPISWPGIFSPILSLSFRMFGNITGGVLLMLLLHGLFTYLWRFVVGNNESALTFNVIALIIMPFASLYFDMFDSLLQAFVFTVLTMSYWATAVGEEVKKEKRKKINQQMETMVVNQTA
ncbi:F0F1 ATP synthase subunit A [Mycoplasma sp. 1573]